VNKSEFLKACKKQTSSGDFFYGIYDNFLPEKEYNYLKSYVTTRMGWGIAKEINANDASPNDFYMCNHIFSSNAMPRQQWTPVVDADVFSIITSRLDIQALARLKANLYMSSKEHWIHAPHIDYLHFTMGALVYITDCDAPTYLADGTEVESKENRLLIFNSSSPHSSSAPTNVPYRVTINLNYFGGGVNPKYLESNPSIKLTKFSSQYPFAKDKK